ncbi:MAG: NAD(P)-dependent oxidoreductase [Myxococcales bacterium]|nr:NAD(P)-dependent oxidoreductase [Myxococcales bacterium]
MITGATGFVGGALAQALLADGDTVVAATRGSDTAADLQAMGARVRPASLADPNELARVADGCELIYHCVGVERQAITQSALPWLHVAAIENVLSAAAHAGVRRVVLLSCGDVTLSRKDRINWREQQPLAAPPYDAWCRTKLMGEEVALHRSSSAGVEVAAIRPGWLWGAGDRTQLPALCREACAGGIRLFGSGDNLFSSAHVDNVVHALRLAANAADAPGGAFHVTDGEYQTSSEFFGALAAALGTRARRGWFPLSYIRAHVRAVLGSEPPWPADVLRRARGSLLDCQRAITDLGYTPKISVQQGMAELATWVTQQGGVGVLARTPPRAADPRLAEEFEAVAANAQEA